MAHPQLRKDGQHVAAPTDAVTIRNYGAEDLAACRALWVELTAWHRQIFGAPQIGGIDPGSKFDEHLACVGSEGSGWRP